MANSIIKPNLGQLGEDDEKQPGTGGIIDIIGTIVPSEANGSEPVKGLVQGDSNSGSGGG